MPKNYKNPSFSEEDVKEFSKQLYGIDASASIEPLDSEVDQNFLLKDNKNRKFVFKIANILEKKSFIEAQNQAMQHISERSYLVKCSSVIPTLEGVPIPTITGPAGESHLVRLLDYLPGTFFAHIPVHSSQLLKSLGKFLGLMDKALENFWHPAMHRYFRWDLKNTWDLRRNLDYISNIKQRDIVHHFLQQFKTIVIPILPRLRTSIIHNDANDYNILVDKKGEQVTGIIDFGDMVHTYTICELAIGIAYAIHKKENPLEAAAMVVKGYHEVHPLQEVELEVLFYLICARLCATVLNMAYQQTLEPDNQYLKISVAPALAALEKLILLNPQDAFKEFKAVCKIPPVPKSKTYSSQEILKIRNRHLGSVLSISYQKPLKIIRGFMQYLWDDEGRTYLDTVNNVCHVGHCHPRVVEAAQQQISLLNTNTRYLHDNIVEYAQRLCDTLPHPLSVCIFVCSGSEANELAIRMAKTYTQQPDFIVVDNAYHGNTNAVIEISPYKFDGPGGTGPATHIHKVRMPDLYRGDYKRNDTKAGEKYAQDVLAVIQNLSTKNKKPAAFFHESLLSVGGQIILPDNYLKTTYQYTKEAGGICIADEVQVGFGRVGSFMWGFEAQGVVPDIVTMGKPIGNGHPLAAVITTPEIAASFDNGMEYFNTFGGNPVSCAVGLAVLDVIRDEKLQQNAHTVGSHFKTQLKQLMKKYPIIGDVRGLGLFLGIELVLDRQTLDPAKDEAYFIAERMKEQGILISVDGPLYNVLKIKPPLVFTQENADHYVTTLDKVLASMV
jgi:4-aminobutyrate aminotransferase-like enzyme/Ser/Thr protein kinase RdoA (MazF antagonist)